MFLSKIYSVKQRIKEFQLRKFDNQGTVYMFHNITQNVTEERYAVGVDNFKDLLDYSMGRGEIVSSKELEIESLSKRFVITFDDAYESVFSLAFPVLKEKKCPFTIFMSLEYLDKAGYLNESMLKEMLDSGLCTLGYHALEHTLFRPKKTKEKERLIECGRERLEKIANETIEDFAFPYGSVYAVDLQSIKIAKQHYRRVYMTLSSHFNRECIKRLNYVPRVNINDWMAENIMHRG